jgi:hypothetical protein
VHFDGAQLNPPAAMTAQELEALLGTKPSSSLIGDHTDGLKLDMQFIDDVRVYKGTVTKVKKLRHKTVYVCEYDDADTVQHTEEELRIALRGDESDHRQTLKTAPKCAARRAYSTHAFTINHDQY